MTKQLSDRGPCRGHRNGERLTLISTILRETVKSIHPYLSHLSLNTISVNESLRSKDSLRSKERNEVSDLLSFLGIQLT